METCFIKSPLGIAKIVGDEIGIAQISLLDDGVFSKEIPKVLQECVLQLQDYFEGKEPNSIAN